LRSMLAQLGNAQVGGVGDWRWHLAFNIVQSIMFVVYMVYMANKIKVDKDHKGEQKMLLWLLAPSVSICLVNVAVHSFFWLSFSRVPTHVVKGDLELKCCGLKTKHLMYFDVVIDIWILVVTGIIVPQFDFKEGHETVWVKIGWALIMYLLSLTDIWMMKGGTALVMATHYAAQEEWDDEG